MIPAKRLLVLMRCNACSWVRFSSISTNYEGVTLKPKFSNEEQQKILTTLNNSNAEQLSRFDVTQGRIKNLESWRNKKGPFKSIADVLEVDGLGVKVLERLCESIVTDNNNQTAVSSKSTSGSKNRRQFIYPLLSSDQASTLSSAVGLHIGPAGISWTKLYRDENRLESWGFHDFSTCPKKMLPTDTFKLAMTVLEKIPTGALYVFEASPNISPQANKQLTMMTSYNQQMELTSMLLALINTSPKHTLGQTGDGNNYTNCVYHLRANLSARLFRTLMGSERVSSTATITTLLQSADWADSQRTLPCTAITVEQQLEEQYYSQVPMHRELMGQALLLVITFMDLCVYKNPVSLSAVAPGRK